VDICLKASYGGPFKLIFYCYYDFPTDYREDIIRILGKQYFKKKIEDDASGEFKQTVQDENGKAVVTFNKGIFNLVSKDQVERYIKRLLEGELIQSQVDDFDRNIPIFFDLPKRLAISQGIYAPP